MLSKNRKFIETFFNKNKLNSTHMKKNKCYEETFETVYSIATEHYPSSADDITVEIFKNEIFPRIDKDELGEQENEIASIAEIAINYCVNKRFGEIYECYFLLVYGIACRYRFINPDDATQRVFEKKILPAIRKKKFVYDENYTRFIAKITKHACNTIYNRNKERQSESLDEPEYSFSVSEYIDPSLMIDLMIDLERALEELSRRQCLVMIMTIKGHSDDEIAKELESTVTAIRQSRYYARKKLATILI